MKTPRASLFSAAKAALAVAMIVVPIHEAQTQPPSNVPSNRTDERLLRSWQDTVKVHGRDQTRTVEVVYDYAAAIAVRRTYDTDGALLFEEVLGAQPQPSREEIAEAFAMVRNDRALGAVARLAGAKLDGGFILEEADGEPCGRGTRCIQVFMLSQSRWGLIRHTAADMRSRRLAHRSFRSGRTEAD